MPKYDLSGNPLPEAPPPAPEMPVPILPPLNMSPPRPPAPAVEATEPLEEAVRYDLAGNPLPPVKSLIAETPLPPLMPQPVAPGPSSGPLSAPPSASAPAPPEASSEKGSNLGIGLIAAALALLAVCVALAFLAPKHATAPTGYTPYVASDKSFSCDAPTGWTTTGADKSNTVAGSDSTVNGVLFQNASAQIDITTDTVATLVASNLMKGVADPLTSSKSESLHKQWKIQVSATHKGYVETPVADFQGGQMGEGILSEWTANGNVFGLGGKIHGYRASLVGGDKTAEVVCQCLESDWPALKPAFLRVLGSITEGVPAGPGSASSAPPPASP